VKRTAVETTPLFKKARLNPAIGFLNTPTVAFLCLNRSLSSWSLFDSGLRAQSITLAAQYDQLDSTPAFLFASHSDLVREELAKIVRLESFASI